MPRSDFYAGVMVGLLAAGLIGFVSQTWRWSRARISGFFEPQKITLETKDTPADVLQGCLEGIVALVFLVVLLALMWYLVSRLA